MVPNVSERDRKLENAIFTLSPSVNALLHPITVLSHNHDSNNHGGRGNGGTGNKSQKARSAGGECT